MKLLYLLLVIILLPLVYSLSMIDLAPRGFVYVASSDFTAKSAITALNAAQNAIDEMEALNLSIVFAADALKEARQAHGEGNFEHVVKLSQLIVYVRTESQLLQDELTVFSRDLELLRASGLDDEIARAFYENAKTALREARTDDARDALEHARAELKQSAVEFERSQALEDVQQWFFVRHRWPLLFGFFVVLAGSVLFLRSFRVHSLKKKIVRMRSDCDRTEQLVVDLQKRCFIEKKMMPLTYRRNAAQYEEHLADLKRTLPVLEAQLEHMHRRWKQ